VDYAGNRNNLYIVAISLGFGMIPLVAPKFFQYMPKALGPLLHSGILLTAIIERVTGQREEPPGPAPLEAVPLEARAVSGSVQPESDMAALLEPEPLLVAPGEIIVGARVEAALDDAASRLGLASTFVRSLRARGMEALEQLPPATLEQVRARAEVEASSAARAAALDVLGRLGVGGEVKTRPGGVVTIDLTAGASPTALRFAQELQTAQGELPSA
ncbi:MAG TPA: hypothetical protein PKY87_03885, partial [Terricaulis sp.]|nr:hypothetical protein [Terricaulis sp.]